MSDTLLSGKFGQDYQENGSLQAEIDARKALYKKRAGQELTDEEAKQEVVSDLLSETLTGSEEQMRKLTGEKPSLMWQVQDWVKGTLQKLRGVSDPQVESLKRTERLLENALDEVSQKEARADQTRYSIEKEERGKWTGSGYDFTKAFAEQVDDWESGKLPERSELIVGTTPKILRKIGFSALPVTINQTHMDYMMNAAKNADHVIDKNVIKQLPELIQHPIAVFTSATHPESSVVALVEAKSKNGKQVVLPIQISTSGELNSNVFDLNRIASVQGRNNAVTKLLYDAVTTESSGNVSVFYMNKTKTSALLGTAGLQLPGIPVQNTGYVHNITDKGSPVKTKITPQTESRQFKSWFGKSLVTDESGQPNVQYHSTAAQFNEFQKGDIGFHFGAKKAAEDRATATGGTRMIPVYLSIQHPLSIGMDFGDWNAKNAAEMLAEASSSEALYDPVTDEEITFSEEELARLEEIQQMNDEGYQSEGSKALRKFLQEKGFDGIRYLNDFEGDNDEYSWIAFEPNQVKSATENRGTFFKESNDIRYSFVEDDFWMSEDTEQAATEAQELSEKDHEDIANPSGFTVDRYKGKTIDARKDLYKKRSGQELTDEEAKQEVVSDLLSETLTGSEEQMRKLTGEKPSLMRQVLDWVKGTLQKLRGVSDPQVESLRRTERLLENALDEVSRQEAEQDQERYSIEKEKAYLLNKTEYGRLQRNLSDKRYNGYHFVKRPNGGFLIDMDNLLVYTDKKGNSEQVLEINVSKEDLFTENDIVQYAMQLESEGYDYELCEIILQCYYGEGCAHFRSSRIRQDSDWKNTGGAGQSQRGVRQGNRSQVSSQEKENRERYSLTANDYASGKERLTASQEELSQSKADYDTAEAEYTALKNSEEYRALSAKLSETFKKVRALLPEKATRAEEFSAAKEEHHQLKEELTALEQSAKEKADKTFERYSRARSSFTSARESLMETMESISETRKRVKKPMETPTAEESSEYMKAVQSGQKQKASELFRNAAEKALSRSVVKTPVYHYTNAKFNEFDRSKARRGVEIDGFFFAPDTESSKDFGNRRIAAYIDLRNPAVNPDIEMGRHEDDGTFARLTLESEGHDGVIRTDDDGNVTEYIVFDENAIKSADPVTYDDRGKVVPLSERFSRKNDIRYSIVEDDFWMSEDAGQAATEARELTEKDHEDIANPSGFTVDRYKGKTIDARKDLYKKRSGQELTDEEAKQEVVSDLLSETLTGSEEQMRKLTGEKPSLMRQVLDWVKGTLQKLRGVSNPQVESLKRTERLLENALDEVSQKEAQADQERFAEEQRARYNLNQMDGMSWNEQMQRLFSRNKKKQLPNNATLNAGQSGSLYRKFGMEDAPIVMERSVVTKAMRVPKGSRSAHQLSEGDIKRIGESLQHPVAVIDEPGRNSVLIITGETREMDGAPIGVAVEKNQNTYNQKTHVIRTAFAFSNLGAVLENAQASNKAVNIYQKSQLQKLTSVQPSDIKGDTESFAIDDDSVPKTSDNFKPRYSLSAESTSQTESRQFKSWFGKSLVTDDSGQPNVQYHSAALLLPSRFLTVRVTCSRFTRITYRYPLSKLIKAPKKQCRKTAVMHRFFVPRGLQNLFFSFFYSKPSAFKKLSSESL